MTKFKILVADNDADYRLTLARDVLEPAGYDVVEAGTLDAARTILESTLIHSAVVDIRLTNDDDPKDTSGLHLCEEIDPLIPKVVHTAYPPEDLIHENGIARFQVGSGGRTQLLYLVRKAEQQSLLGAVKAALDGEFEIVPSRRIAILTGGNDSPGMNAAIWGAVRAAIDNGIEVIGVEDGYRGLLEDRMRKLRWNSVSDSACLEGSILGAAWTTAFKDKSSREKAAKDLVRKGITGLIVIGDSESIGGAKVLVDDLAEKGLTLQVVAVPGTVNNDLHGTEMSLGAESAANSILRSVRELMADRAARRVFIVEVMGAYSGYLALAAALGSGADAVVIPEKTFDGGAGGVENWREVTGLKGTETAFEKRLDEIEKLLRESFAAGKRCGLIFLSEAHKLLMKERRPDLGAEYAKERLEVRFKQWPDALRPDVRVQKLEAMVRSATPHVFDIHLGARLGVAAVEALHEGRTDVMVGWKEGGITKTPLAEVIAKSNRSPKEIWKDRPKWQEMLELQEALACPPQLRSGLYSGKNRFLRQF